MKSSANTVALLAILAVLAACAPAPKPHGFISEKAMAALPADQDLSLVIRDPNGCYRIQSMDDLSGYISPLLDSRGRQVCDELELRT